MAKALKIAGLVVGAVAIAATGIGLALGPTAGATFLGTSAATWGTIATVASLASVGIGVVGALAIPKPSFNTGQQLNFVTDPQSGLPYAMGRTRMSGLRIYADTHDGYGDQAKQDMLTFGVMLSVGGQIDSIEKFVADDTVYTFNAATGRANDYSNWMGQKVWLGGAMAAALALQIGATPPPGWTSDHQLSGITHALWAVRYDASGDHFAAGVPEPQWVGKWVRVYDPRKDSTYPGGSGSHRALDESTYEWSENPALHALTWALGRWQNGKRTVGIGAPVANIRLSDFVEAANVADANGWTMGGVEWTTDSKWEIFKRILQAGGCVPTQTGGLIGCMVNTPRVSIATITGAHLLDNLSYSANKSRRDRFNTVIPRFRDEDSDWQIVSGAPVSVPDYVTADGGRRTKEITYSLVQRFTGESGSIQAGQLAAYDIVNSREAGPIKFTTGPQWVGIKTGDVVTLDVPDEGFDAQPVLIKRAEIDPATTKVTFEAETETAAKHAFALGQTTTPPPPVTLTPPDLTPPTPLAALWGVSGTVTGDGYAGLLIVGTIEFPGADSVVVQYREIGATEWTIAGEFAAISPFQQVIAPLTSETAYDVAIAYRSDGIIGLWNIVNGVVAGPGKLATIDEGATRGAPIGTPVAGIPAEEVVATMEENKQKVTDTLAQLGAAQLSIQELFDTYGDTEGAATSAAAAALAAEQAGQSATTSTSQAVIATDKAAAAQSSATLAADIAENIDGDISELSASVEQQAGAIVTLEGKTQAYLENVVAAGSSRAAVRMVAGGSSSGIELQADAIRLGSGNLPAMDVVDGKVQFYGQVQIGALPVTDYANMIPDHMLSDITNWQTYGQSINWSFSNHDYISDYCMYGRAIGTNGTYTSSGGNYIGDIRTKYITVEPGKEYTLSGIIDPNSGSTGTIHLQIWWHIADGTSSYGAQVVGVTSSAAARRLSVTATAPADAVYATVRIRRGSVNTGETVTGTMFFYNLSLRRAADSELIVDGDIKARHIGSQEVTTDKLAAGNVTVALGIGSSGKIVLDGANNRILISD